MVFNSSVFLVFFILFFILYWWINNRMPVRIRNAFTILSSYIFYGWWDWRFLGLIIISSLADFIIGRQLGRTDRHTSRKALLVASLAVNLSILGFFKYFNFFVGSFSDLVNLFNVHLDTATLNIILPVGISFYTFQTLSYTIDVYRKKIEPTKDFLAFFAFVSFFPQLVAGPIERASHLLSQFMDRKRFSMEDNVAGLRLVLWGLFKKIVIADNFGLLTDSIFNQDAHLNGLTVLAGAFFFALQIYADFSGYSDIAIGISRILGFDLMTNFTTPYFSRSIREFWKRWHISLSTWFRDYVYIPLGGNQARTARIYFNIFLTFLLSGLWHGADGTFLIWGGLFGLLLIVEKHFRLDKAGPIYYPVVLVLVILLWIPFRAQDFTHLTAYIRALVQFSAFSSGQLTDVISGFSVIRFLVLLVTLILFIIMEYQMQMNDFNTWIGKKKRWIRLSVYYFLFLALMVIGNFSVKPNFIYFQF